MSSPRIGRFAWWVLGVNLAVVAWGAFVRASGSGAGCGSHWPLCNGVVIPRSPTAATLVEATHRATSGIAFILVAILLVRVWRHCAKGHPARPAAAIAMALMIAEAGIGAGLVLFQMVAHDASVGRVYWLSAHLLNTFALLAAIALTAWWSSGAPAPIPGRGRGVDGPFMLALLGTLAVGVTGALTALGDTLFPADSLASGMRQDFSPAAHFLLRLRVLHPTFAVAVGIGLLALGAYIARRRPHPHVHRLSRLLGALVLLQWGVGVINLSLLAPVPLQLVHLLIADFLWLSLVLLVAAAHGPDAAPSDEDADSGISRTRNVSTPLAVS